MLIKNYGDYLKRQGLSETTNKIYSGKLQIFLDNGYSEADLIGAVDQLIVRHSKGGQCYDAKDSGNTAAALRKLKEYKLESYIEDFYIIYKKDYSSFIRQDEHVSFYKIENCEITIEYSKNNFFSRKEVKTFSKKKCCELIDIMLNAKPILCPSNTAIKGFHEYDSTYSYYLDDKCSGDCCRYLFEDIQAANWARKEYEAWLCKFIAKSKI